MRTRRAPRVLFLAQFFPPETFAGANRAHALARALDRTHTLTVLALHPGYPDRGCYRADATRRFDAEAPFVVHRRFSFSPHRYRSRIARALGEQGTALLLALRGLRVRSDVVVTSSPSMFLGPVALIVATLTRAAFVWDVRDVTWAMAAEQQAGAGRLLAALTSLLDAVMWATARRCHLFVAATPGIAELARRAGVCGDRILVVENGIDEVRRFSPATDLAPRTRPVVSYVGLLGQAQRLHTLVDAAQRLPDVDFVIVGEGPQRADVQTHIDRTGCRNVSMRGYVEPGALPEVFAASDLLFAQVVDSPTLNQTARPSKLLEYMATGRPLVYAGRGDAVDLINRIGCGVCVAPESPTELAEAIRGLLAAPDRLAELGSRGAAYVTGLPSRQDRMDVLAGIVTQRFSPSGGRR